MMVDDVQWLIGFNRYLIAKNDHASRSLRLLRMVKDGWWVMASVDLLGLIQGAPRASAATVVARWSTVLILAETCMKRGAGPLSPASYYDHLWSCYSKGSWRLTILHYPLLGHPICADGIVMKASTWGIVTKPRYCIDLVYVYDYMIIDIHLITLTYIHSKIFSRCTTILLRVHRKKKNLTVSRGGVTRSDSWRSLEFCG